MIVVFGSLNMDLVFQVQHLPRPGETRLCPGYVRAVGGKGANQAAAAARAGATCRMVGSVGDDEFGSAALEALAAAGVDCAGVKRTARPTGCAAVVVDSAGENQIAVASGANLEARADDVPDDWLDADTTLVLQLEVPPAENWRLLARAHARGVRTVVNTAPALPLPDEAARLVDVLVANEHEARLLADGGGAPADDAVNAATLAERYATTCIVTRGPAGAVAATPAERFAIGALAVEVVDSTGAGDAFVGSLAAALDGGAGLAEAMRQASAAGALACTVTGALPSLPRREAILAALDGLAPAAAF